MWLVTFSKLWPWCKKPSRDHFRYIGCHGFKGNLLSGVTRNRERWLVNSVLDKFLPNERALFLVTPESKFSIKTWDPVLYSVLWVKNGDQSFICCLIKIVFWVIKNPLKYFYIETVLFNTINCYSRFIIKFRYKELMKILNFIGNIFDIKFDSFSKIDLSRLEAIFKAYCIMAWFSNQLKSRRHLNFT